MKNIKACLLSAFASLMISCTTHAQEEIIVKRPIDWSKANTGVLKPTTGFRSIERPEGFAVPLLLPSILPRNDIVSLSELLESAQLAGHQSGYIAVIAGQNYDVIIDASNSTIVINRENFETLENDFIGDISSTESGGLETTLGRYGAMYHVEILCLNENDTACITKDEFLQIVKGLRRVQ